MAEVQRCRSCGAPIIWCVTASEKRMPLDAEPVADGNIVLDGEKALYLGPAGQRALAADVKRYKSHFATCPNAKTHRIS
jgi:hypothetical protein